MTQPASAAKWCDGRSSRSALAARLPTRRCCRRCTGPVPAPGRGARSYRAASAPKWWGRRGRAAARLVPGSRRAARPAAPPNQSSLASLARPRPVDHGLPYARAASPPKPRRCRLCGLPRLPRRGGRRVAGPAARQPARRGRAPQRLAPHFQATLRTAPSKFRASPPKFRAAPLSAHPAYPRLASRCRRRALWCAVGAARGWGRTGPVHPAPGVPTSLPSVGCGSTCDSSIRSCSRPRWDSPSITAFSSQRSIPEGAQPVVRRLQFRIHRGQHLCHFPGALARGLLHQLFFDGGVQPALALLLASAHRAGAGRRLRRRAVAGSPGFGFPRACRVAAGSAASRSKACCSCAALLRDSEPSRSSSRAPRVCVHKPHRVDAPPGGARSVVEFVHDVVEQAAVAAAQVEAASLDLAQVVEDQDLQGLFVARELFGLHQEQVVGQLGDGREGAWSGCGSHSISILRNEN